MCKMSISFGVYGNKAYLSQTDIANLQLSNLSYFYSSFRETPVLIMKGDFFKNIRSAMGL